MKEIKFRVWGKGKRIIPWSELCGLHASTIFQKVDGYHVMQFTGIKDKNGKDVYEGDIILFQDEPKYKSTWEVRWQSFGFRLVDGIGYRLLESETYPKVSENGEIVGNIYETGKYVTP